MTDEEKQLKRCSRCKCTILLEYFSINRKGEYNKTCDRCLDKRKEYRQANRDKSKQYYENNKERLRKYHETNKEVISQQRKGYRQANKEKIAQQNKIYYEANKEKISQRNKIYRQVNKEKLKEKSKQYRENNKEKIAQIDKIYRENNKERISQRKKQWEKANRDRINKNKINRKKTDPVFRITCNLRGRLRKAIKNNTKSKSTLELLGCTPEEVKAHLQKQFTEGMTWENYGEWHIDHIKPCCSFDLSYPEQQQACFHFTNLQPLWAEDNLRKGGSTSEESV